METKYILRIPFEKSSQKSTPDLLVCVTSPSKTSTSTLSDLAIQATEGESAFTGHLYSSRLSKILSQDASLSIQEFESVLAHILLEQPLSSSRADLKDISAIAVWSRDEGSKRSNIRIRFKREISDIRHYLGEIVLKADAEVELDVLDWTRVAVSRGLNAQKETEKLRLRLTEAEGGVQLIREQLNELLRVKTRDEEVLMGKFVKLLNEKKARIRELEIQLGRGRRPWPEVDEEVKEEENVSVVGGRGSKGKKGKGVAGVKTSEISRGRKRKQAETLAGLDSAEQDDGDDEPQREEDVETDRESIGEAPRDGAIDDADVDMSVESDDLDAPSRSQHTNSMAKRPVDSIDSKAGSNKHHTSGKQHALRTRKSLTPASEDDGTTDDEL